jgi:oligopeptide transport system permease protein
VLLQFVFAVKLRWVPTGGWDSPRQWILPVLANSLGPILTVHRYTRGAIIDVAHANYVRTARAKGLTEVVVVLKHALRHSLIPILTVMGPLSAALLTGSFVVEYVFAIPGMGRFFITAVTDRDYTLIMGVSIVYTLLLVLANLLVDLLYGYVDPRIRVK